MELHRVININKEYEEKEMEWRKEEQVCERILLVPTTLLRPT